MTHKKLDEGGRGSLGRHLEGTATSRGKRALPFVRQLLKIAVLAGLHFTAGVAQAAAADRKVSLEELEKKGFTVQRSGNTVNVQADGNLAPNKPFEGKTFEEIDPQNNPVDLAVRANRLFKTDRNASHRIALAAQAFASFDIARVSDASAHEAWAELAAQSEVKLILAWGLFQPSMQRDDFRAFIAWARKAGPPQYNPRWMIQHGTAVLDQAVNGTPPTSGLVAGFDAPAEWQKVCKKYEDIANDEAVWSKREADIRPDSLSKIIYERKSKEVEFLSGKFPAEAEKFGSELTRIYAAADPTSGDFILQFSAAQQLAATYIQNRLMQQQKPAKDADGTLSQDRALAGKGQPSEKETKAPVAKKVPGRPGIIVNPHSGSLLDASGLPSGTMVKDPKTGETMIVP